MRLSLAGPLLLPFALIACGPAADNAAAPVANDATPATGAATPAALPAEGQIDRAQRGAGAPPTPFTAPDGRTVTLADFRGLPVLVNLWATWCAPCKAEMPTLETLARREAGKLHVLTISQDLQGAAAIDPYWAASGFRALKPYRDPDVRFSTAFAATLPMTILYDAAGREQWRMTGGMDWAGARAAALIAEAR